MPSSDVKHVLPRKDFAEHVASWSCACDPGILVTAGGTILVQHHAAGEDSTWVTLRAGHIDWDAITPEPPG